LAVFGTGTRASRSDVSTLKSDNLADRYERNMSRIEQIKRAVYQVKVQWECEFDDAGIVDKKTEMLTHPIVRQSPLCTRDALYGSHSSPL